MAYRLGLFEDRLVILGIIAVELVAGGVAPLVEEKFGQVEIFFLSRERGKA